MSLLLEVIVQSVADARAAAAGGADRLEVVRAIGDGGLTPSSSLVRAIASETPLPLRVMVRENVGYRTDPQELPALQRAAREFADLGVDGLVIGFEHDGEVAMIELGRVLEAAPGMTVTFHRAFDALTDPLAAIDRLASLPAIDRILTSGGSGSAAERARRLAAYSARAGARLTVIAGGGVDEAAVRLFAETACVREIHVGRAAREGDQPEAPVSAQRVQRLREIADASSDR